jgi:thioredoxin 1
MIRIAGVVFIFLLAFGIATVAALEVPGFPEVPVKGMVTMVDIGAEGCTPCKIMAPILRDLEERYRGRAAIIAINVGADRSRSKLFGARLVPTQIFYDKEGREVSRHEGFLDRKSIEVMLEKLGVGK